MILFRIQSLDILRKNSIYYMKKASEHLSFQGENRVIYAYWYSIVPT